MEFIGNKTFENNTLEIVDFSKSEQLKTIGEYAFNNAGLNTIDLGKCSVLERIETCAFTNNTLFNLDLSGLTSLSYLGKYAFSKSKVEKLSLQNCSRLDSIDRSAFEENLLQEINFEGCSALSYIGSYAFSENKLLQINFSKCNQLKKIDDSAFSTNELESLSFEGCSKLDTIGSTAFFANGNLVDVDLSSCTSLLHIGSRAMYEFNKDVLVHLPEPKKEGHRFLHYFGSNDREYIDEISTQYWDLDATFALESYQLSFVDIDGVTVLATETVEFGGKNSLFPSANGGRPVCWEGDDGQIYSGDLKSFTMPGKDYSLAAFAVYSVELIVKSDDRPLEGATVSLEGYAAQVSDANGLVTFINDVPANDIVYTVSKALYNTVEGSISVVSEAVSEEVVLELTPYDVTFTIKENGIALEGVTVSLEGYADQVSDANGLVTFTDVAPANDISYTVSKELYNMVEGTVSVVSDDISEEVVMELTPYYVTFAIKENGVALEGVTVSLNGYTDQISDVNGLVTFTDVAPANDITYTVSKELYNMVEGTVSVVSEDVSEAVALELTPYAVTFTVKDNDVVVEGATVSLEGYVDQTTDALGTVTFTEVAPGTDLAYSVTKDTYDTVNGVISVVDQAVNTELTLQTTTYDVVFTITGENGVLVGATASLAGYGYQISDANGKVTFANVIPEENISCTLSKDGYEEKTFTISVVGNKVEQQVELILKTYAITLTVERSGKPLAGATVAIEGMADFTTDAQGVVIIENLLPGTELAYAITKGSMQPESGTVRIEEGENAKNISLTITDSNLLDKEAIQFYPNPVNETLFVKGALGKALAIYSLQGVKVYELKEVKAEQISIDMSDRAEGMYLLQIDQNTYKVLVKR